MSNNSGLTEKLNSIFGDSISISEDEQVVFVSKQNLIDVLKVVKENSKLSMLAALTAVEYDDNFEMIYPIMQENANVIKIKVKLPKDAPSVPTISSLWKAADVQEREVFDLMGIVFEGHKNLKRILCPDNFVGNPLRKDFKLDIPDRF